MLTEDKCEHGNYHCYICEVELLRFTIDELEQQNKQLLDKLHIATTALELYANDDFYNHITDDVTDNAKEALQQIQGKEEER